MTSSITRQMRKWAGITAEPAEPTAPAKDQGRRSSRKPALTRDTAGDPGRGGAPEEKDVTGGGRLSARLTELRERLQTARPSKRGAIVPPDPSGDVEEVESSSEDRTASALQLLDTGTELAGAVGETTPSRMVMGNPKKMPKKRSHKTPPWERGDLPAEAEKGRGLLAISDGTSKGIQSQLAVRAAAVAQEKSRGRTRSRRSSGSSIGRKLIKLLSGKKDKKGKGSSKDKKRTARKRRKMKMKPDPDGDGPTGSSDSSYSSDWESEDGSLSEDELEPPLRKRAKQHPGSVLKMLLSHARSQLDQSSKVALDPNAKQDIVTGVKMASYFAICVKPTLSQNMGAQRDLHHLGLAIDLLRQGDLTLLGDCLASRFIAIHQAAVDGGWQAARHLELFPMEDGGAANSAVLLETRRHAKLAAKAAGYENPYWRGPGRGKGGKKGKKGYWDNYENPEKGAGKKGKDGKGSNKGGGGQGDPNKWKDTKETAADKK